MKNKEIIIQQPININISEYCQLVEFMDMILKNTDKLQLQINIQYTINQHNQHGDNIAGNDIELIK